MRRQDRHWRTLEHGARPTRTRRAYPAGSIRPCGMAARSSDRSRAQHGPGMRQRGRLGGRGAAGRLRTGPEVVDPAGERRAHWLDDGGLCTVARADITCVERTHGMYRYDRTGARSILFRSVISNMPFGCAAFKQGNKRATQRKLLARFEPNLRVSLIPLVAGLHRLPQQQSLPQRSTQLYRLVIDRCIISSTSSIHLPGLTFKEAVILDNRSVLR